MKEAASTGLIPSVKVVKAIIFIAFSQAERDPRLPVMVTEVGCQWTDFLRFEDKDGDDRVHVTEFYAAFSHLYGKTTFTKSKVLQPFPKKPLIAIKFPSLRNI